MFVDSPLEETVCCELVSEVAISGVLDDSGTVKRCFALEIRRKSHPAVPATLARSPSLSLCYLVCSVGWGAE